MTTQPRKPRGIAVWKALAWPSVHRQADGSYIVGLPTRVVIVFDAAAVVRMLKERAQG